MVLITLFSQSIGIMLTFESTHEYYIGPTPSIFYCAEHSSLIVTEDHEDRLVISGIDKDTMLKFARKLVQKDLDETLAKFEDKDAAKEPADAEA